MTKYQKALGYIVDAVDPEYSAPFTYGVRETLDSTERGAVSQILRNLQNNPKVLRDLAFESRLEAPVLLDGQEEIVRSSTSHSLLRRKPDQH